ncbi:MAG: hypothetical protein J0L92_34945 [Deltaproteobacteria bacterium]|nr:hypothetical protein [Deltaproteobacteria bacterium]
MSEVEPRTQSLVPLQLTGALTYASVYIFGFAIPAAFGVPPGEVGILAIPFAGPWMCMVGACRNPRGFEVGLAIDGVLQVGGLAMLILGSVLQVDIQPPEVAVLPWGGADTVGVFAAHSF